MLVTFAIVHSTSPQNNVVPITLCSVHKKVWFHCHHHGWLQGPGGTINLPTIILECAGKLYPTHETVTCPSFAKHSITSPLEGDQLLSNHPNPSEETPSSLGKLVSNILNPLFIFYHVPNNTPLVTSKSVPRDSIFSSSINLQHSKALIEFISRAQHHVPGFGHP